MQQSDEILKSYPHNAQAQYVAAVAKRSLGDLQGAAKLIKPLANAMPDASIVQFELGLTLKAEGSTLAAIAALEKTVALDAKNSGAWQVLGELLADRGEIEAADKAFHRQMATSALHPGLLKAVELTADGKLGMAEGICRDYLYRYPTDVNAIRLLADIGLKLDIFDDAEKLLTRCLELAPDYHLARNNYASALSKAGKFEESIQQLQHLEKIDPQDMSHPVLAASVLVNMGDYDNAIKRYQQVLTKVPNHSRLQMSLGHALKTVGHQEDAIAAYRRAISAEPSLGEAYWSLANLKTFRFTGNELAAMRQLVESKNLDSRDELHLCFSLGKALEDLASYDEAFAFYAQGNELSKKSSTYSSDANTQSLKDIAATCSATAFAEHSGVGHPAQDPIFIVGLPRSGSTLLEQILASHSRVDGTMELPNILQLARRLAGKKNKKDVSKYPDALWQLSSEQYAALGQEYLDNTRIQRQNAPFFIDKMPNNFAHVGLIHLILPNAKIIDARRHPMATCFSGFKQLFAAGQEFTYSLDDIGRYYADYVQIMLHWDQVLPGKVLRMDYEAMIDDTPAQVRRLLAHCGLEFEESCLDFHKNDRAVRTASSEQVRQPIYRDAKEQWRNFEKHLNPLSLALKNPS